MPFRGKVRSIVRRPSLRFALPDDTKPSHPIATSTTDEDGQKLQGKRDPPEQTPEEAGLAFLWLSVAFNGAMFAAGVAGAALLEPSHSVLRDMAPPWEHLDLALLCCLPLFASLALSHVFEDKWEPLREIKEILWSTMPVISTLPLWGLGLLSLGAGVGEEALFRGFIQAGAADAMAASWHLDPPAAEQLALAGASVVFGAAHAASPLYFLWSTLAGALFGWEYLQTGSLVEPMATHSLYDVVAFWYLVKEWKAQQGIDTTRL
eukprot:CAMPEP_0114247512 /NCGR_PEP_ID=MMETSP0058-20121206/13063_1 /TAXON_ID=36894 /ORGANISM="Pyramimonas parkeae, CCMP726" /LENGTH=262 /DNA_ID=CAMNT_0001360825 /DNA_START=228 /DNA_END=1016 /DNA_ORIENTATION=+